MKTVRVNATRSYDIYIGKGILEKTAELLRPLHLGEKIMIVTDDTVADLYLSRLKSVLLGEEYEVCEFVFLHGEQSKCAATYLSLADALAAAHIDRSDCIIALGGGVVGDLAGFAAATYLRGIRFVQIPTTLLAAVDSSVGGKTAIDIEAGKNLVGAFWQPSAVICDPTLLDTLPCEYFSDGMAEVIKYAMIRDASLFDLISGGAVKENIVEVIARCVSIKRDVVEEDECDKGVRAILNFGHTAAHAIEAESSFGISHGRAVGIGMMIITRACAALGLCSEQELGLLSKTLADYSLTLTCPYGADVVYKHALSDKKREGGGISLIMCTGIGSCRIEKTAFEDVRRIFELGVK